MLAHEKLAAASMGYLVEFSLLAICFMLYRPFMSSPASRLGMVVNHMSTSTLVSGGKYTPDFKLYYKKPDGAVGSYFHDVPLNFNKAARTVNMVVEIPRWTNAKMEISTSESLNPIVQDTKKGKLRFINNIWPFKGYIHNYGAIPQTWEDSTETHEQLGLKGDNDPVDVCEIGTATGVLGEVIEVKVLGALALIDDGELDWKIIAINVKDPLASKLTDIEDVNRTLPGLLDSTREWFRNYKVPTGKPKNEFGFDEQYKTAQESAEVIEECHESWQKLVAGKVTGKGLPTVDTNAKVTIQKESAEGEIPKSVKKLDYVF